MAFFDSAIRVVVGGEDFSEFMDYEIENDVLQPCDAFSFTAPNDKGQLAGKILKGDTCEIIIDDALQMTGRIDEVEYTVDADRGAVCNFTGRDLFQFLVDCSAPLITLKHPNLQELAERLSEGWIDAWEVSNEENRERMVDAAKRKARQLKRQIRLERIRRDSEARNTGKRFEAGQSSKISYAEIAQMNIALGEMEKRQDVAQKNIEIVRAKAYPNVKVEPNETPMDILQRRATEAGMLVWLAADGTGVIAKPNYSDDPIYKIRLFPHTDPRHAQNNAMSGSVRNEWREQYSKISVYGTKGNTKTKYGRSAQYEGTARDALISAYRPLIMTDGDIKDIETARNLAEDQIGKRRFDGEVLEYVLEGHYNNGLPIQVDNTVDVHDGYAGVQGHFYLSRRRYILDTDEGQSTEVELHPKDEWLS